MMITYLDLVDQAEQLEDLQDYYRIKQAIANGEEVVPSHVTFAILDGQHPLTVWREYRQLSLTDLAALSRVVEQTIQQIETRQIPATPDLLKPLAQALNLTVDDLLES